MILALTITILANTGCNKKHTQTLVEYKTDTVFVKVPARQINVSAVARKDTIIVKRDTIEKVSVRFVKIKDTIKVDCLCDSIVVTKIDTVKIVINKNKIVKKTTKPGKISIAGVVIFCVLMLGLILKLIK